MTLPHTTHIHRKLNLRLMDKFHQNSFANINHPNSKLRTYGLLKATIGLEDYLTANRNTKYRNHLTKFRLSNHTLMIVVGRHQKLPKTQRFCPFCPQLVEDKIHFLINCNRYAALRNPLLETCRELRQNVLFYHEKENFVFMMTCS